MNENVKVVALTIDRASSENNIHSKESYVKVTLKLHCNVCIYSHNKQLFFIIQIKAPGSEKDVQ